MFSRSRYKEEMSDEKRAMIVIGIFVIVLIAIMAFVGISSLPPPANITSQNVTQNSTFIRIVTLVK